MIKSLGDPLTFTVLLSEHNFMDANDVVELEIDDMVVHPKLVEYHHDLGETYLREHGRFFKV